MKNRNTKIANLLDVLRDKLATVIPEDWQIIVVLMKIGKPNHLFCHVLYLNNDGLKTNLTEKHVPPGTSELLLELQDELTEASNKMWNEVEIKYYVNTTIELEYIWTNSWETR